MTRSVLHLIPTLKGGGAEHQLVLLTGHLHSIGWDVIVGYVHSGVHLEALERTGAQVHRIEARANYDPTLPFRVQRLVRQSQPAIVQTWLPQMDIIGGLAARIAGVPWIVSERSSQPMEGRRLMSVVRDGVMSGAAAVISNSALALERWARRHPSVQRFHVPNAVSLTAINAAAPSARVAALRQGKDVRIAIAVGRLVELKRFDVFIEAMKRVCAVMPAAGLICGDGPLRAQLEARVQAAGIADRFVLTGFVPDVVSEIKSADALVALSEYEGRPNAVIEAMAARTPLVVSDIPEHREILDAERALFVRGTDPEEVATTLLELFRDRPAAIARASRARQIAEEWDTNRVADEYAAIYDQVLRERRGKSS